MKSIEDIQAKRRTLMYYIYYGGGGLIAALFYGLIAYGAAKLIVFLVPVFIALSGLLFLWSVAKNGIKNFFTKKY